MNKTINESFEVIKGFNRNIINDYCLYTKVGMSDEDRQAERNAIRQIIKKDNNREFKKWVK